MTQDQCLDILVSFEAIFEQAANLACELRNKVSSYNKSQTGAEGIDIVTEADLRVQEFVLTKLAETPLIECELIAEESTPTVSRFKGTNGLVLSIDPIDGTATYVAGGKHFSLIVSMHNKKDLLYSYYRYPLLNWTKRILKNQVEDAGDAPEVKIKPDIEPMKMVAYLAHAKPVELPFDIEEKFRFRGLSVHNRKEISDETSMTMLLFLGRIAGACVQDPIAYDCLGILHYAYATGMFEIYSTVDLSKPTKGPFGVYYPGLYIVWKKND
jgi:Inositol monophosphatase family